MLRLGEKIESPNRRNIQSQTAFMFPSLVVMTPYSRIENKTFQIRVG